MNQDQIESYIKRFSDKQGISFITFVETDLAEFSGNHFFELSDIVFDIDNNIPASIALNYSEEGTEGITELTYQEWYWNKTS